MEFHATDLQSSESTIAPATPEAAGLSGTQKLVIAGVSLAAIGAGYWWYRKRKAAKKNETSGAGSGPAKAN